MPKLLDLFCGQGGAAAGYASAGFEVVGVDHEPQSRYPYDFIQEDAIDFLEDYGTEFDVIHASPPCQLFSAYRRLPGVGNSALNLIPATRSTLQRFQAPYVIENVPGAPLLNPTVLCGSMFGLLVRRHRLFETNWALEAPTPWDHKSQLGSFPCATNRTNPRKTCEIGVYRIPLDTQKQAMGGCEWMDLPGLSQAIPPAYTQHIGTSLMGLTR